MTSLQLHSFGTTFEALFGYAPFPWQCEFYRRIADGDLPRVCDLPTGLGKTAIVAMWLIALAHNPSKVPRRLVYVVNRRTVVDQTTSEVEKLRENLRAAGLVEPLSRLCACPLADGALPLAISTLRGQFADNREWSADPSRPAVICGTVDMIGSRLLFSGYRIGFKSRPLHAGFLGQDALLVHDEAHLEPAFQKLIDAIECEQTCRESTGELPWPKLRVMQLTATGRNGNDSGQSDNPCGLTPEERNPPDQVPDPPTKPLHHVWRRLKAKKTLALHEATDGKDAVAKEIADLALKRHKTSNAAVLIFVRTLDNVKKVCDRLTNKKNGIPADHVQQLTGTMRGKERDELVENPMFKRFLKGGSPGETVYLVCTSAGEVGIDISADHMVCDLSTFESMAQRLGRVNRFGDGDARIDVVVDAKLATAGAGNNAPALEKAVGATYTIFRRWTDRFNGQANASPLNLRCAAAGHTRAFAPEPTILPATDILFDAWALTTIRQPMPGRPAVADYLHGIADDLPQTSFVWRAELDLLKGNPNPKAALKAIVAKHGVRPHESLTVRSYQAVKFLKEITAPKVRPELLETRVVLIFAHGLELTTVKALIDNPGPLNADPTLVLPASFGGLDEKGVLAVPKPDNKKKRDTTDTERDNDSEYQLSPSSLDIADVEGYEREQSAKPRRRVLIDRSDEGWTARAMPGADPLPDDWNPEGPLERSTLLIKRIQEKSGLKVRLVQPIKWNEEDDPTCAIVCLSPPPKQQTHAEQTLDEHVRAVEKEAERLADTLLQSDKVVHAALRFAAKWHDEGKNAPIWQRYIGGPNGNGEPLGKSAQWCDPKQLSRYRHEFGSLLRIRDREDEVRQFFTDAALNLTPEQQQDACDLALHMIAVHHGYGRPHFEHIIDHDFTTQQSEETHIEVMRRYGRLQRKYGRWGLAYLESLLRAADWAASAAAGIDPEVDDDDLEEGEA